MSIEAKLTRLDYIQGKWRVSIRYTDTVSGRTKEEPYSFATVTKKQLRDLARRDAVAFTANEVHDVDIALGTTIDVTPDPVTPPTPPTQAQLDEAAWFADWETLKAMNYIMATLPGLANQTRLDAAAALEVSLAAGWKNSYLSKI